MRTEVRDRVPLTAWVSGARPRTLTLSAVPVVLGTAAAAADGRADALTGALALLTTLLLQIGVNFANDHSDGVRGTDRFRVGPPRLTGSGAAPPTTVRTVALTFLGAAAVSGLALVVVSQHWWLLLVGAAALAAAWLYTGGPRPYGYAGLGEVAVFVFFGLVGTLGTQFVEADRCTVPGIAGAVAAGSFACAVLMVNNIRDIGPDEKAGKRTLAVRLGVSRSRSVYAAFLVAPYLLALALTVRHPLAALAFLSLPLTVPALLLGLRAVTAPELVTALKRTSAGALAFAVALGAGLALTRAGVAW
ncbi:1,4-dihydroxy-2-naphthoate polyprenyltransferase [Jatrophihabitans sp. YIM 134969]